MKEIISRANWKSGNALSLFVSGSGQRVAKSYNGSSSNAPKLIVSYRTGNTISPTATPTPTLKPTATPTLVPTKTPTPTATPMPTLQPTVSPTATPTPTTTASIPAALLNLTNWKLTLPIGTPESPTEILQPQLATYVLDPWFVVSGGVRFRAPVNAPTTSGSNYPRSELREMTNNGKDKASWSSTAGTHTMTIDQAITAVPATKKHVVAGQIHDASDDVIVIRLEGQNLYVNVDGSNKLVLDSAYTLGKRFTVKFEVSGGQTKVYYNGNLAYTLSKSYSGAYFKAGAYTQSNCSKESANLCLSTNYGEVIIYSLSVTHQ